MWAYIKENKLQDPKNKQMIKCDEKLAKIVPTKKFRGFGMTKYLKEHMNVGEGGKPKIFILGGGKILILPQKYENNG